MKAGGYFYVKVNTMGSPVWYFHPVHGENFYRGLILFVLSRVDSLTLIEKMHRHSHIDKIHKESCQQPQTILNLFGYIIKIVKNTVLKYVKYFQFCTNFIEVVLSV